MTAPNKFTSSIAQRFQQISTLTLIATSLVAINLPTAVLARPIVVKDGVTFDFQGCARSSDGNDIVCRGSFLSRKGEQSTRIYRQSGDGTRYSAFITNLRGKQYIASEIIIGEDWSCRNDCAEKDIIFVEGVNYSASIIFREVSLPSSKIVLVNISVDANNNLKFRNISVNSSGKSSSQSSGSEVDNVTAASTTDTPSRSTETVSSNCPDRSQQFVAGETDSFNIYICGQNRPTQYSLPAQRV
ncbi:hypothetical protein [Chamaesiphon polymorphus]|uniref:Uncharacterized protein n=1 Tax=Chamaesiphon polymorphus CCALA 037 TaxID=2107692 RepID=A0A2T1G892_9CYAN|nr:hypothetical protein [Chamaesiphon polymorphus]PSB53469.1 hypothetical protein C7B77_19505 [Chamaesiphon polymorphus CCALA 037]